MENCPRCIHCSSCIDQKERYNETEIGPVCQQCIEIIGGLAYVAAPWQEKGAGRRIRDELQRRGVGCSARWIDIPDDVPYDNGDPVGEVTRDVEDLRAAARLVLYVPENDTSLGGRDTELGIAIALNHYPIHLIGKPKQMFHNHPDVTVYPTIDAWEKAEW